LSRASPRCSGSIERTADSIGKLGAGSSGHDRRSTQIHRFHVPPR
jgi:hypothetical protein